MKKIGQYSIYLFQNGSGRCLTFSTLMFSVNKNACIDSFDTLEKYRDAV